MTHYCRHPFPYRRGQTHRCHCGAWWMTVAANNLFDDGPLLVWQRVGWWNVATRFRIWSRYGR